MGKLSDKMELFCQEYLIDFNATQAAIRAKYSEKTARQIAADNLSKVDIKKRISELINDYLGTEKDTLRMKVIKELSNIAFGEDDYKTADRIKSLELLGKYGALWTENYNINIGIQPDTEFVIVSKKK